MKRLVAGLALQMLVAGVVTATPYKVTIDTTPLLLGTAAQLVFDFIDGGPPSNSVSISNFATDGTLGSPSTLGGVTGTLPLLVTLTDATDAFNEYLTDITLGTTLSFIFTPTQNPPSGSISDAFSMFLLNPGTGLPLFDTGDPSGNGTLLLFAIDGTEAGDLTVFSVPPDTVGIVAAPQAVPLPGTAMLMMAGVLGLGLRRRKLA